MRQKLGEKKLNKYRELTGLNIIHGWVRGGTGHRVDFGIKDGSLIHYYRNGTLEDSGMKWRKGNPSPAVG